MTLRKIALGGGCHWCTEAYFQSLKGVMHVEQGWVASIYPNQTFSEAVIVHYDAEIVALEILIAVHLHTHSATKAHRFRAKYRSAVYVFEDNITQVQRLIDANQPDFDAPIITKVLLFDRFKANIEKQLDYYKRNKDGVFCKRYISPKLLMIQKLYLDHFREI